MTPTTTQVWATGLFGLAILHTFTANRFKQLGNRYRSGSVAENFFHFLGEIEVVFGIWAGLFFLALTYLDGYPAAVGYVDSLNFTEPAFVFVIMAVAATRPIIQLASHLIQGLAFFLPLPGAAAFVLSALIVGPLLGSFITEPAAMTVTALILKEALFESTSIRRSVKYLALGVLFVNVSIGGVLTPYAAPPVLMVASKWGWDFAFMMDHFGWKAVIAVIGNAALLVGYGWRDLAKAKAKARTEKAKRVPVWLTAIHVGALAMVVFNSHHVPIFLGVFLFFVAIVDVTREYQSPIQLKESLLVACFLAGLVVLGGMQSWWLQPILSGLSENALFLICTSLTAVTDNAALTFLGSQVSGLSDSMKYAMVAGAVAGGGLTVIANAPNPAGYSILQKSFGRSGVSPLGLFLGALVPTLVDMAAFWFLPHLSI